jgi:hypothetical protein
MVNSLHSFNSINVRKSDAKDKDSSLVKKYRLKKRDENFSLQKNCRIEFKHKIVKQWTKRMEIQGSKVRDKILKK